MLAAARSCRGTSMLGLPAPHGCEALQSLHRAVRRPGRRLTGQDEYGDLACKSYGQKDHTLIKATLTSFKVTQITTIIAPNAVRPFETAEQRAIWSLIACGRSLGW